MVLLRAWRAATALQRLHVLIIILAVITAIPVAVTSYERIVRVHEHARTQLIVLHRLWELHPEYKGRPDAWTRVASRLLTDNQLLRRVNMKYGPLAEEIERDYRRDLAIADAEVVFKALAVWGLPLVLVYLLLRIMLRRRPATPAAETHTPTSFSDPRYLPRAPQNQSGETQ